MENKEIPIEEQKEIALDILKTITAYCDSNNLKYYLAYGTLLGAVRHKGFIPWDDDIDIVMNREDYTFFINHFKTDIYDCVSFENDTFYFPYAKVIDNRTVVFSDNINDHDMGISVDVFPFDYISDSERESIKNQKKSTLCWKGLRYSLYNNVEEVRESKIDFDKVMFYILSKCLGMKYWKRRIRSYIKKYTSRNKTEYCGVYVPITPTVIRMYDSVILEHRSKYKFEDEMFYSFENADYFLSTTYGKYMILPPEEQRIPHFRKAYWKEP